MPQSETPRQRIMGQDGSQLKPSRTMSVLIEAAAGRPFRSLDLPEAEMLFYPDFFPAADADRLLRELLEMTVS